MRTSIYVAVVNLANGAISTRAHHMEMCATKNQDHLLPWVVRCSFLWITLLEDNSQGVYQTSEPKAFEIVHLLLLLLQPLLYAITVCRYSMPLLYAITLWHLAHT